MTGTTTSQVKMAKADEAEVDALINFHNWLESQIEELWELDNDEREKFLEVLEEKVGALQWRRTVIGYQPLIDNFCDKTASTLEYSPELNKIIQEHEEYRKLLIELSENEIIHLPDGWPEKLNKVGA
jgi:hypothetical protein